MTTRQKFENLARRNGVPVAWNQVNDGHSIGLLAEQSPASVVAAAGLVQSGVVMPLNLPIDAINPPFFGRELPKRQALELRSGTILDEVVDRFYPQAASQWDALGHVASSPGEFYGGATIGQVCSGARNTIDHAAGRGIVGRGVLLDVEPILGRAGRSFDPSEPIVIDTEMLESARHRAKLTFCTGDVLLIHTGFLRWYMELTDTKRTRVAERTPFSSIGLAHTEDMARYLWDSQVCAVATDSPALEVCPPDYTADAWPWGHLHRTLLGGFGMHIGELWWLSDLAANCEDDGRYEFLLTSAPMNLPGAVGSPANAIAIK